MDTTKAGRLIAEQMEALDRDYGDKEGVDIGAIVTIVEIAGPEGSHFRMRTNVGPPAMVLGILRMAEDQWIQSMRTPGAFGQGGDGGDADDEG